MTTHPTDKELEAFAIEEQFLLFCDEDEFTQIARAVLAKWGAPAQAAPAAVARPSDLDLLAEWYRVSTIAEAGERRLAVMRAVLAKWGAAPTTQPAPQPSPASQADSQPALDEATAMNQTLELAESGRWPSDWVEAYRRGYSDRAARDPAGSVTAPAGGVNWQDISTAPKDGTRFVAVGQNYGLDSEAQHTCIAQWFRGCWMEASDWNETSELKYLTHWMPLPPLPGSAARDPAGSVTAPAAGAVAHTISDAQIEAMPVWRNFVGLWPESRREIVDAVVDLLTTPPTQAADSVLEDAARVERERICAAIKAEDDYCVDHGDYMLDSDDCIKIVRGEWVRPDFAIDAAHKEGANHD